jgi:hypothetical protein
MITICSNCCDLFLSNTRYAYLQTNDLLTSPTNTNPWDKSNENSSFVSISKITHLYINISIFGTLEGHSEILEFAKKSSSRMFLMQGYNSISFKL